MDEKILPQKKVLSYRIDPVKSQLTVHTEPEGLFGVMGHPLNIVAKDLSGNIFFSKEDPSQSSVKIEAKAASLSLADPVTEKDQTEIESNMREKVLAVEKFPEISFKSTKVELEPVNEKEYKGRIHGELSLHGVTRSLTIPATVHLKGKTLAAEGKFPLHQTSFKIKPFSALGGTLKVKDELKIAFRISARLAG
jgi:polyisoprenoid-binding protein YceI